MPFAKTIFYSEMTLNFADPLSCVIEDETVDTDEVESEDEVLNRQKKNSFVMETTTTCKPLAKLRKIRSFYFTVLLVKSYKKLNF